MHLTGGGSVQRPLTNGPKGGWLVDPTLQPLVGWLHGHTLQETVTRNPRLEVSGSRSRWLLSHVARPVGQHLVRYQLNKSVTPPWTPINTLPTGGIQQTTLYF
jgi:hypothetical protein